MFIVLAGFITVKLFVGVVVKNLASSLGQSMMSDEQKELTYTVRLARRLQPLETRRPGGCCTRRRPAGGAAVGHAAAHGLPAAGEDEVQDVELSGFETAAVRFRGAVYDLVIGCGMARNHCTRSYHACHSNFDRFISLVVAANVISMAWQGESSSPDVRANVDIVNRVCLGMFALEAVLLVTALGGWTYLRERRRLFDGVLVVVTMTLEAVVSLTAGSNNFSPQVLRTARLARMLVIFPRIPALRVTLQTLVVSMRQIGSVALLCLVLIFVYTIEGRLLFGGLKLDAEGLDALNELHVNFDSFGNGALLLFRCITGDGWPDIMHDYERLVSDATAGTFFMSFVFLGTFVALEFFTAVIIESFQFAYSSVKQRKISPGDLEHYQRVWLYLDYDDEHASDGLVPFKFLKRFLILFSRLPADLEINEKEAERATNAAEHAHVSALLAAARAAAAMDRQRGSGARSRTSGGSARRLSVIAVLADAVGAASSWADGKTIPPLSPLPDVAADPQAGAGGGDSTHAFSDFQKFVSRNLDDKKWVRTLTAELRERSLRNASARGEHLLSHMWAEGGNGEPQLRFIDFHDLLYTLIALRYSAEALMARERLKREMQVTPPPCTLAP